MRISYAAERKQFGQQIGKFQGICFKLADMAMELKAAELLTREAAWKYDQGSVTEADMSMAKLKATEVLAMIADEAIQIHGGMGLMDELPLERIWRDARVERIWEGTSEIQRHIISRELLRPLGGVNRRHRGRFAPRTPRGYLETDEGRIVRIFREYCRDGITVQAGTPMTVTGECTCLG